MWHDILTGFAIYLVIEGMIPFAGPNLFRQTVVKMAKMDDNHLRITGLTVASIGVIILYVIR